MPYNLKSPLPLFLLSYVNYNNKNKTDIKFSKIILIKLYQGSLNTVNDPDTYYSSVSLKEKDLYSMFSEFY